MPSLDDLVSATIPARDFDLRVRGDEWVGIIIHHTGLGKFIPESKSAWKTFNDNVIKWLTLKDKNFVSAHFQIDRNGFVYKMVDPRSGIAWHAGKSSIYHPIKRKTVSDVNRCCIGIELLGDGNKVKFEEEQYVSLSNLCKALINTFPSIDPRCITGHESVAPGRKVDPGRMFDWQKLFAKIYS